MSGERPSILPRSRLERALRNAYGTRRQGMSVSVMAKAILDALFVEVIKEAAADAKAEGKKRAAKLNLMRAVRNSPEMNKIFGNYLFFSKERLKVDPLTLLTKRKREKALAERAEKKQAVPTMAED